MSKGVLIAGVFFLLGVLLAPYIPVQAEQRLAYSDLDVSSVQRVPFENYEVYPDQLVVKYPGLKYAKVASNSMAPIITDKSTVFEKIPESASEIKVNDVISFYEPSVDGTVMHLVTDIVAEDGRISYKTKGVANPEADPWTVPYENVKGIVVGTFR